MHVAILTFEGYNELDSLIAFGILNRIRQPGWRVSIACPAPRVRSMNGVVIESQISLGDACGADAVIVGSGVLTREVVEDASLMAELRLDPSRQLLCAQCSGTLIPPNGHSWHRLVRTMPAGKGCANLCQPWERLHRILGISRARNWRKSTCGHSK